MRSLFRPLAVLAMTGGLVFASALPAWAHYPLVSGTATCSAGQYVINWTVKNSESTQKMTVDVATVTAGTVAGLTGQYNGGASRSATTTLAGTTTGTVTLSVHGTWPDGVKATKTASVVVKGDCKPPVTTTSSTTTTSTSSTTTSSTSSTSSTTSTSTTTTTAPTTTTTAAPTTTTTAAPTTTTTSAPTTTTTAAPTTTTTAGPKTTTTAKTEVLGESTTTTTTGVPTQVLGEQLNKPAPGGALPHTGAAVGLLAFIGGGLLWIGLPLSRYKRRREGEA